MESKGDLYISRFKSVVLNTNRIGILFMFTLIYVWFKSVEINYPILKDQLTLNNKSNYFKRISSSLHQSNSSKLESLYVQKKNIRLRVLDSVTEKLGNGTSLKYKTHFRSNYIFSRKDTFYTKAANANQQKFNKAVLPIKRLTDSLKEISIRNLTITQIKIDVPTLNSIEFKISVGIPIWMCLTTFFIVFIYTSRDSAFKYLTKGLQLHSNNQDNNESLNHLDLNIIFWLYPFKVSSSTFEETYIRKYLNKYNDLPKSLLLLTAISVIIGLQISTAVLICNLNDFWKTINKGNDFSILSNLISFGMLGISTVVLILWIFIPKKIHFDVEPLPIDNSNLSRRKFITATGSLIGLAIMTLPISQLNWIIPRLRGRDFNYRRKKPKKLNPPPVNGFFGFYINKRKKAQSIHYFNKDGHSLSLKTIGKDRVEYFLKNLKAIQIIDHLDDIKLAKIGFPYRTWAYENAANAYIEANQFNNALHLLQKCIEIDVFGESSARLTYLFKKNLELFGTELTVKERKQYKHFLTSLKRNIKYYNKQINSKTIMAG